MFWILRRKTFKAGSMVFLGLGSAFLQGSKIRHPCFRGDDVFAILHDLLSINKKYVYRAYWVLNLFFFLLCCQPGLSLAEEVGYGPIASAPVNQKAKPANEIKGSEEYNKGCDLFTIAKLQASKGNINGEKQLLKEAHKHFEAALEQNPKLVEAQSNIAFISLTLREYRRATGLFQAALKINPHHLNSLNGLATAYALNGDIDQSIETFDTLLKLAPSNSEFFFNKGSVLQKAGRISEARRAYEDAIRVNPKNQLALFNLGTLMENQGNLTMAKTYYERARDVEIGNTAGLESLHRLDAINAALKKTDK